MLFTKQIYVVYQTNKHYQVYEVKVSGKRKIYHSNTNQKKVGVALLISDIATSKKEKLSGKKRNTR